AGTAQHSRACPGAGRKHRDSGRARARHAHRRARRTAADRGRAAARVTRPRVLLADHHAPLLAALQRFLVAECDVVGAVTDGRGPITAAVRERPDVIVMDMRLVNGIDGIRQLKCDVPATRIVLLTICDCTDFAAEAFRAGADGFLLKRKARSELLPAIRAVMSDRFYVTPTVTAGLSDTVKLPPGTLFRRLEPRPRGNVRRLPSRALSPGAA